MVLAIGITRFASATTEEGIIARSLGGYEAGQDAPNRRVVFNERPYADNTILLFRTFGHGEA